MRLNSLVVCFAIVTLSLCACAYGTADNTSEFANSDAGTTVAIDAGSKLELVCGSNFCGNVVDKNTGATANCGGCPASQECGDNGTANLCGSECMPMTAPTDDAGTYLITPACDLYFGPNWGAGYGTQMQFPPGCNFTNGNTCVAIFNQVIPNEPCGPTVCGSWICCVDNPEAGVPALLPGAIANNDGGLP